MTYVSHLEFCNKAYYFGTHRLRNDDACKSNLVKVSHTHCGDIIAILIFPIWRLSGIFLSPRALYAHRCVLDYYDSTTFGKQPRQVTVDREGQCCQRTQRVIALRRDIRLKSLSKGGRVQTVLRRPGWSFFFFELNADGPDMLFGTGVKCTCSGTFKSVLKTA